MKIKNLYKLIFVFFVFALSGCDFFKPRITTQITETTQTTTTITDTHSSDITTESDLTIQLNYIYNLAVEAGDFSGTYEEWLESVSGPQGEPGKEITLQVNGGYIQWQYVGDTDWTNLIEIATLIGPSGQDGIDGEDGQSAYEIYLEYYPDYDGDEQQWVNDLVNGELSNIYTFIVTFNSTGGSVVEAQVISENDKVLKPDDPIKEGYIFDGWYKDNEPWIFSEYMITEDIILTAVWHQISYEIALIIDDFGTIDDKSFNESAWDGVVQYAEANDISYKYYHEETINESIEAAINNGAKIVVCPGFNFETPVFEMQQDYPEVAFLLLDGEPNNGDWLGGVVYETLNNTYSIMYQEEQAGFLAGYAAVMDGYRELGFIGGIPVPAVVRFGYGFMQGADYAASELDLLAGDVTIRYDYANAFLPSLELEDQMDFWYTEGVEIIFAAAGGAGQSVMDAAEKTVDGKVIGVDVDQAGESERVITSAMKCLTLSVLDALTQFYDNDMEWPTALAGENVILGAENNGVGLPTEDTSWRFDSFTIAQYNAIYAKLVDGTVVVSQDIDTEPTLTLVDLLSMSTQYEIALILDEAGSMNEKSFNKATWDGVVQYAEANDISHKYYQEGTLIESIEAAINNGAKIVVCPGFHFETPVFEMQQDYPEVAFLLLDGEPNNGDWSGGIVYETLNNTHSIMYQEEQSGFLAGYAAVMEGYRELGFIGGMPVPAVVRFGYGFIQGAEYAASELDLLAGDVTIRYDYANTFEPNSDLEAEMDIWYSEGIEVIFSAAGWAGQSVMAAAEKTVDGKVIGVDIDQVDESERVITSAMKNLTVSVNYALTQFYNNEMEWPATMAGETGLLGAEYNAVGLPTEDTSWRFDSFTIAQYNAIYAKLVDGTVVVSQDIDTEPTLTLVDLLLVSD